MTTAMEIYRNYIAGEWVSGPGSAKQASQMLLGPASTRLHDAQSLLCTRSNEICVPFGNCFCISAMTARGVPLRGSIAKEAAAGFAATRKEAKSMLR